MNPLSNTIIGSDQSSMMSPFIANLYRAIEEQQHTDIINWSENGGQYFVIYSMELFKTQVLPKYFTTTSYSTFVRQLNKYGFRKVNIKKDEHIFYHPVFKAENKSQLHTIKRKRKGNANNGNGSNSNNGGNFHHHATNGNNFTQLGGGGTGNFSYHATSNLFLQQQSSPMIMIEQSSYQNSPGFLFGGGINNNQPQNSFLHQTYQEQYPVPVGGHRSQGEFMNPPTNWNQRGYSQNFPEPMSHQQVDQQLQNANLEKKYISPNNQEQQQQQFSTHGHLEVNSSQIIPASNSSIQSENVRESDWKLGNPAHPHIQSSPNLSLGSIDNILRDLAQQCERQNEQQQDLLKNIKTMEIAWKQENSKTAKSILNINREMKEELKNLREWVDRYDFADLRIAKTNQLKSNETHKDVKSVNEQLHVEKELLHQLLCQIFQNQVSKYPNIRAFFMKQYQEGFLMTKGGAQLINEAPQQRNNNESKSNDVSQRLESAAQQQLDVEAQNALRQRAYSAFSQNIDASHHPHPQNILHAMPKLYQSSSAVIVPSPNNLGQTLRNDSSQRILGKRNAKGKRGATKAYSKFRQMRMENTIGIASSNSEIASNDYQQQQQILQQLPFPTSHGMMNQGSQGEANDLNQALFNHPIMKTGVIQQQQMMTTQNQQYLRTQQQTAQMIMNFPPQIESQGSFQQQQQPVQAQQTTNLSLQLAKRASENVLMENQHRFQRLSSHFTIQSPLGGTPRNIQQTRQDFFPPHLEDTQINQFQTIRNLVPQVQQQLIGGGLLTSTFPPQSHFQQPIQQTIFAQNQINLQAQYGLNQSSYDSQVVPNLSNTSVSNRISHLEPAYLPSNVQQGLPQQLLQKPQPQSNQLFLSAQRIGTPTLIQNTTQQHMPQVSPFGAPQPTNAQQATFQSGITQGGGVPTLTNNQFLSQVMTQITGSTPSYAALDSSQVQNNNNNGNNKAAARINRKYTQ